MALVGMKFGENLLILGGFLCSVSVIVQIHGEMFRPLVPVSEIHRILEVDAAGCELLSEVDAWAESAKSSWRGSSGECFVLGFGGAPTVMPIYSQFVTRWERAGNINPFQVDWCKLDMRSLDTIGYVTRVLHILRRLVDVWGGDEVTFRCDVYRYLEEFFAILERLLSFFVSMYTLRTSVIGGLVAAAA